MQFQKNIQILYDWKATSFAYLSNCEYFKFYKCQLPSIFVYNTLKWCILTCQGTKSFLEFKEKIEKYKVTPNYGSQNQVLVMTNFEINFLSNHN